MQWHAVSPEFLVIRELDGELAVLNGLTGNTHLLEPLAAEVLRTLMMAAGGLTASELVTRLAEAHDTREDWLKSIEAALSEFQRLGLARPVD